MYFFAFRVRKPIIGPAGGEIAFASSWINSPLAEPALKLARTLITDHGWEIEEVLEAHDVTESNYSPDEDGLQYYEQAQTDGEVVVFYLVAPPHRA
jgi:hypothetical protein